jgi:hypothetical protein
MALSQIPKARTGRGSRRCDRETSGKSGTTAPVTRPRLSDFAPSSSEITFAPVGQRREGSRIPEVPPTHGRSEEEISFTMKVPAS